MGRSDIARGALACFATLLALAASASEVQPAGRRVYEQRCRTCHGGTSAADLPIGPDLAGIAGAKAGTRHGGVYSRAVIESGIVWDRDALRGFLSKPRVVLPEAMMPSGIEDAEELERLLDFLEAFQ